MLVMPRPTEIALDHAEVVMIARSTDAVHVHRFIRFCFFIFIFHCPLRIDRRDSTVLQYGDVCWVRVTQHEGYDFDRLPETHLVCEDPAAHY
jgi:hypothetical protein